MKAGSTPREPETGDNAKLCFFFFFRLFIFFLKSQCFSPPFVLGEPGVTAAIRKGECVIQRGEVPPRAQICGPTFPRVGLQTTGCQQRTRRVQSEPVGTDGRAVLRSLTRVSFHPAEASCPVPTSGIRTQTHSWKPPASSGSSWRGRGSRQLAGESGQRDR